MRVIDKMLRQTAEGTEGINYYDHAPEPYANAIESEFPRIWVYDTGPQDEVHMNHSVTTKYNVLLEISDLVQFSDKTETIEDVFARVHKLWIKFINRLSRHPSNHFPISKISRIEILHKHGHNVAGYLCTFTVQPLEDPEYQCP